MEEQVELLGEDGRIILEVKRKRPREGWRKAFRAMVLKKEDALLIDGALDIDLDDWEW
jgi:hypothetical protein